MLKPYSELRKIDVLPFCEMRKAKDDKGKDIEVPYLNWAKCKELLHENGAETVYFTPVVNDKGSSLFMSSIEVLDKYGNKNRIYEVRVKIVIDDMEFEMQTPVMNGASVVSDNSLNQLRVSNAQARAFVKGVAIRTGLGFGLWVKDNEEEIAIRSMEGDGIRHNIMQCKNQLEQMVTAKISNGIAFEDMLSLLHLNKKQWETYLGWYDNLQKFEKAVAKI